MNTQRTAAAADSRSWARRAVTAAVAGFLAIGLSVEMGSSAYAQPFDPPPPPSDPPPDSLVIRPLPVITPVATGWGPKYPFPYDQTKDKVTPADITAMGEMCQWYNAQYAALRGQIDRLQFSRLGDDGKDYDYSRDDIQPRVDIVSTNIAQAVDFLTPRAQALTQAQNPYGDNYFPAYEGEAFYKLWEQLSNVNNGILAHQPAWFTGPSVQKAKRWGSDIHRSHVCDA